MTNEAEADVIIIFCDLRDCIADNYSEEMLARPVVSPGGKTLIFLDSQQAWADADTLSSHTYAAFNNHVQLLQVTISY